MRELHTPSDLLGHVGQKLARSAWFGNANEGPLRPPLVAEFILLLRGEGALPPSQTTLLIFPGDKT